MYTAITYFCVFGLGWAACYFVQLLKKRKNMKRDRFKTL